MRLNAGELNGLLLYILDIFSYLVDGGRKTVTHTASVPPQTGGARESEGRAMIPSGPRNTETPLEPKQQKQPTADQGNKSDLKITMLKFN